MTYREKLLDPRWQKKRLQILERDNWECRRCRATTKTLHVHHRAYGKGEPWDVPDLWLETLCEPCHTYDSEVRHSVEQDLLREMSIVGFTPDDIGIFICYLETFHSCVHNLTREETLLACEVLVSLERELKRTRVSRESVSLSEQ